MKIRAFIFSVILILTVLVLLLCCATEKKAVKVPIEPLYGNWVNPDYNTRYYWAKINIRLDGTFTYCNRTDFTEGREGTFTIIDSWMDSDGNKYYKMEVFAGTIGKEEFHELWRINDTNTVFELITSQAEYPTEIDSEHARYRILYRQ